MTKSEVRELLLSLPVEEQLELAEEVWDNTAPLTEEQRQLIDERLEAFEKDPEAGVSWEEARARIEDTLSRRS